MKKLELDAVGICVTNIETMVKWYRDIMGFNIEWDGGPFANAKMSNGIFFNLYQEEIGERVLNNGVNKTFQITCGVDTPSEVDTEYARLLKAGGQSVISPRDEPYGLRICFVADPEGNQIEICAEI